MYITATPVSRVNNADSPAENGLSVVINTAATGVDDLLQIAKATTENGVTSTDFKNVVTENSTFFTRMAWVRQQGKGGHGSPSAISADFDIKALFIWDEFWVEDEGYKGYILLTPMVPGYGKQYYAKENSSGNSYVGTYGYGETHRTLEWTSTASDEAQFNAAGHWYKFLMLG